MHRFPCLTHGNKQQLTLEGEITHFAGAKWLQNVENMESINFNNFSPLESVSSLIASSALTNDRRRRCEHENYLANEFARKADSNKGIANVCGCRMDRVLQKPRKHTAKLFSVCDKKWTRETVHTSSVVFINMAFATSLELLVLFTANNVIHSMSLIFRHFDAVFTSFLCWIPLAGTWSTAGTGI